ncbi:uncharacterized protein RHO17_003243 [Thomomys bottae]
MPRGQKSKLRSREKRRQTRDGPPQNLEDAQATTIKEEKATCWSSGDAASVSSVTGFTPKSQEAPTTTMAAISTSPKKSGKGIRGRGSEAGRSSKAGMASDRGWKELLMRKSGMVMQYLLLKYKMKEPILKGEMIKIVNKRFKEHFPEILKRASDRIDLVFGLELKEVKPRGNSYTLESKLDLSSNENLIGNLGFPRTGLLTPLLGVIFLNDNCTTEEEIWEFLNTLGVYDGCEHFIFGDTRKLITHDLVQEKYLEYRQVPNSDPPRYEFLWGPRAHIEANKMKIMEFLAKVNEADPTIFPAHYEEALREEEERAQSDETASRGTTKTKPRRKVKSKNSSYQSKPTLTKWAASDQQSNYLQVIPRGQDETPEYPTLKHSQLTSIAMLVRPHVDAHAVLQYVDDLLLTGPIQKLILNSCDVRGVAWRGLARRDSPSNGVTESSRLFWILEFSGYRLIRTGAQQVHRARTLRVIRSGRFLIGVYLVEVLMVSHSVPSRFVPLQVSNPHSCLLSPTTASMPPAHKSNRRSHEKRFQGSGKTQKLKRPQPTTSKTQKSPFPQSGMITRSRSACMPQIVLGTLEKALSTTVSEDASSTSQKRTTYKTMGNPSQNLPTKKYPGDILSSIAQMLVEFMMDKYVMKKPIMKKEMLKIVDKKYKKWFQEILRRAAFNMEVVFGIDLQEISATNHSYAIVNKMNLPNDGRVNAGKGYPKTGLLMNILGVIFLKGNCASEEKIWEFLNKMKIYDGKKHFLFGEPRKLITGDFVKLKYLEYRKVPNSDPPHHEFLWGPRAHTETTKMKILEFWARINHTLPSTFNSCYDEALQEEKKETFRHQEEIGSSLLHVDLGSQKQSIRCLLIDEISGFIQAESRYLISGRYSCLRFFLKTTVIMPRGLGSKLRAPEKHHYETQDSHQSPIGPQATRVDKKVSTSHTGGASRDAILSTLAEGSAKKKDRAPPTISKAPRTITSKAPVTTTSKAPVASISKAKTIGPSASKVPVTTTFKWPVSSTSKVLVTTSKMSLATCTHLPPLITPKAPPTTTCKAAAGDMLKRSGKSANPRGEKAVCPAKERLWKDLIMRKAGMLMQYLLYRYKTQQPIVRGEMMKIINRKYQDHFPEILQKASERINLVFGLELKEIKPNSPCYTLVSKAELTNNTNILGGLDYPKNGLLMPLLGVIFLNGNCATEEEVWEFLSIFGVYDGRKHIIFGEPRKLITQDMVQEKYLEYQQVPGSNPPCYQFLWGPRAHAETTKMQVLEFLAKVNDTVPSAFPEHYEEALRDEEERAQANISVKHGNNSKVKAPAVSGTSSYQ